jgi:hypothetical protein
MSFTPTAKVPFDTREYMQITTLQEAKQAAFNGAVRGLNYQGWKRCSKDGTCAWNTGEPGFHCAIGWLIGWEDQRDVSLDDQALAVAVNRRLLTSHLIDWAIDDDQNVTEEFYVFLHVMQTAHDTYYHPSAMKKRFQGIASKFELQWPQDVPQ